MHEKTLDGLLFSLLIRRTKGEAGRKKRQSRARTSDCVALDLWSLLPVHRY